MRFIQHLNEERIRYEVRTEKGIRHISGMDIEGLVPDNDKIRRWDRNKDLVTTVYIWNAKKIIGWAVIKYKPTPKDGKLYGYVRIGEIGVLIDKQYQSKGLAIKALKELEKESRKVDPAGEYIKKNNMISPDKEIIGMSKIKSLIGKAFPFGEEKYRFRES